MKNGLASNGPKPSSSAQRALEALQQGLKEALKTALWLIGVMVSVSFVVFLLSYFEVLPVIAEVLEPLFAFLGLPGEAALVFISSITLNIYSAIAVMGEIALSGKELTIMALMCLVAHNLIIETTIQKKTGSKALEILIIRLGGALLIAFILNLVLPEDMVDGLLGAAREEEGSFSVELIAWFTGAIRLSVKVLVIVSALMIFEKLLQAFGVLGKISKWTRPVMKPFGLPPSVSFLWIVANSLGLAYGAAVMISSNERGDLPREEADLLNYHLAVSHSLIEDTALFAVMGIPVLILILPRLALAELIVWGRRLAGRIFA